MADDPRPRQSRRGGLGGTSGSIGAKLWASNFFVRSFKKRRQYFVYSRAFLEENGGKRAGQNSWSDGFRGSQKQKSLCPNHGTKAIASAIPPKLTYRTSARLRVPSYAPRWITGGIPVGPYLNSCSFGPPSEVHSPAASCPALTIRDSLKGCRAGYFSPS